MSLTRREFLTAIGSLGTLLPATTTTAATRPESYGVVGTVITGDGSPPRRDHAVLVDKGRIQGIVPASSVSDRRMVATPGATILPGIINCHTHRIYSWKDRQERHLKHGVTSVGDAASPLAGLLELLQNPLGRTATAACAGPMLCPPGGYPLPVHSPNHGLTVTSPEQGRERVRQLADAGTSMIKLAFEPGPYTEPWPIFDTRTAAAICDEARRLGLVTRCHVEDLGGLEPALDAGVHTVEHVPHRWITDDKPQPILHRGIPIPKYRQLLERMVRDDVILTPTLDVLSRSMWNGPELTAPVRFFAQEGGLMAVGNDYPYRRTDAGMPMREMKLLQDAGLEAMAVIAAATRTSAMACGFTDRGVLAPGMAADMIVVTGDPLTDLTAINTPLIIIKDGIFVRETYSPSSTEQVE